MLPEIPNLPGKLAAALRTLLAVDPEDRPGDAAVLVEWLAGDVARVRDRERLIADGVSATEKGLRVSSLDLTAVGSEPRPDSSLAKPSGPSQPSQSPPAVASPAQSPARSAAVGKPTHSFRRALLVFLLLFLVLGAGAAVLVRLGWWPGHRHLARHPAVRSAHIVAGASPGAQDLETPPAAPEPFGDTATTPDDPSAPPTGESSALLAQVAGHLVVETVPPGAMVWVDGVLKAKTFADILVGEGSHRVVLIAPGYRMLRDVVDTGRGAILRRNLAEVPAPARGNGFIDVTCRTAGRYPVLLDDEETGRLCPARMLPTTSGKHTVGIFVPHERRAVNVETTVERGSRPASVSFSQ